LTVPEPGQLAVVRGRRWAVADVIASSQAPDPLAEPVERPQHLVHLVSVDDDGHGDQLDVIWEVELGTSIITDSALPTPNEGAFDPPERLDAFLDAVRWGAIANADTQALQAPYRSGVTIEEYQLEPVVRALRMPRANLLIADDVGLGKTIEAGLVAQELLLRHRARTILIVCPASLCVQWRDQMLEKFGLEFRIVDTELLRQLRRTRGLGVNPWSHHPRLITSIDWLKRDAPMRLMRETLPPGPPQDPRRFDLLIVDEVHGAAPSGSGKYAIDSLRTQALRTLAPHCEHRLFLSATPHNGYQESFTALLELLDPNRFARGVAPDQARVKEVMVRRLKSELPPLWDGTPRFPRRKVIALEVDYPESERQAHALLAEYAAARGQRASQSGTQEQRLASDFVLTLLKKRLFSSPAAFANTLQVHRATLEGKAQVLIKPTPRVLKRAIDTLEDEYAEDEAYGQAVGDALTTAAAASPALDARERNLLDRLQGLAGAARTRADTKANVLIDFLDATVRPAGKWNDERVIVFTEYRDTQIWLQELLVARGLGGDRLKLLFGGMDPELREDIKQRFLAHPDLDPVRILLATDAASEGIDLHSHCHRLVHYEIPWNPNRLEQRNGRIDRHGQPATEVLVHHFVGRGWQKSQTGAGSLEADLAFLYIAARKVEAIREDLGSVGPVIADQVQEAMLGRRRSLETDAAERSSPQRRLLRWERDLRSELARLHERLIESRQELGFESDRVRRVVTTGLELARQQPLREVEVRDRMGIAITAFEVPRLTGSWAAAAAGLLHPITGARRPVTFDHLEATGRDDVVLAHAGHRLVQLAGNLLRAEVWAAGTQSRLRRVTARLVNEGRLDVPVVVAHGRLVVTGADGRRLHEELVAAGGELREGRFRRLGVGDLAEALDKATGEPAPETIALRLSGAWTWCCEPLTESLNRRVEERAQSLARTFAQRANDEIAAMETLLTDLKKSIEEAITEPPAEQLSLFTLDERHQYDRDFDALRRRLRQIPADIESETASIRRRYASAKPRLFPVAVTFLVPPELAVHE
jgi:superfamily II DNA or RNA helicase